MTGARLLEIKAALETALADQVFQDPVDGAPPRSPRVFVGGLPPKGSEPGQGEDYPFVVVRFLDGADALKDSKAGAALYVGTWVDGNVEAGSLEVHRLLDFLRVWLMKNRTFVSEAKLELPLRWTFGDSLGLQPHPYYVGKILLSFISRPLGSSRRSGQE